MKAKLNCIMHGMLLVGAMVRRRLTPRGSVPLIAACLVVAFALPAAAGSKPINFFTIATGPIGMQVLVRIYNSWNVPITITPALTGQNMNEFLIQQYTCNDFKLAGGESCEVAVVPSLASAGEKSANLTLTNTGGTSEDYTITAIGKDVPSGPDTGRVAYWSGNGSGYESVTGSYAGVYGKTKFAPGRISQAFNFPATGIPTDVVAASKPTQVPKSYSISLWFKTSEKNRYMWLMGKAPGHMELQINNAGNLVFRPTQVPGFGDNVVNCINTSKKINYDEWNHVVATYDHLAKDNTWSDVRLYLNGELIKQQYSPGVDMSVYDSVDWVFGTSKSKSKTLNENFTGQMEEIAVYDHPLNQDEVNKLHGAENSMFRYIGSPDLKLSVGAYLGANWQIKFGAQPISPGSDATSRLVMVYNNGAGPQKFSVFKTGIDSPEFTLAPGTCKTFTDKTLIKGEACSFYVNTNLAYAGEKSANLHFISGDATLDMPITALGQLKLIDAKNGTIIDQTNNVTWLKKGLTTIRLDEGDCYDMFGHFLHPKIGEDSRGHAICGEKTFTNKATWYESNRFAGELASGIDVNEAPTDGSQPLDWRLPTLAQLQSFSNHGMFLPELQKAGFLELENEFYWTIDFIWDGVPKTQEANRVWGINLASGYPSTLDKTPYFVPNIILESGWGQSNLDKLKSRTNQYSMPHRDGQRWPVKNANSSFSEVYTGGLNFNTVALGKTVNALLIVTKGSVTPQLSGVNASEFSLKKENNIDILTAHPTSPGVKNASLRYTDGSGKFVDIPFSVVGAPPTYNSIITNFGSTSGGEYNGIVGSGFVVGDTTVTIGGVAATEVEVDNSNALSFKTPKNTAGCKDIIITVGGSGSTSGHSVIGKQAFEYTEQKFNVTFDSEGGSNVPNLIVNAGSKVAVPDKPTKIGYIFDKWCTDSALTTAFNFNTLIQAPMVLHAKWTRNTKPTGPATKLGFLRAPAGWIGKSQRLQPVVVALQDAKGNTVTGTASYVDITINNGGVLKGTVSKPLGADGTVTFDGLYIEAAKTYTLTFDSSLQDIKNVWSTIAVRDNPVANLPAGGLFALWDGDGNVNNSVISPNATFVGTESYGVGKTGQAFNLSPGNYLSVADDEILHRRSYSISLWFKASSTGLYFLTGKGMEHMEIHTNGDGSIRFIPVTGMYVDTPAGAYKADEWTHVVATYDYDSGKGSLYVRNRDKEIYKTVTATAQDMSLEAAPFLIGQRSDGACPFTGLMEQVALFDRALTLDEMQSLYENDAVTTYTLTFKAGPGVTLTGQTTQMMYPGSKSSPVTANPLLGERFKAWFDKSEYLTSAPQVTIENILKNMTLIADSMDKEQCAIVFSADLGGHLEGKPAFQGACPLTNETEVLAVPDTFAPDPAFKFDIWIDAKGNKYRLNPLQVTVNKPEFFKVVTAKFLGPPINVSAIAGNSQATVNWSPPLSPGGSPIIEYTIVYGSKTTVNTKFFSPTACTGNNCTGIITNQTNGDAYTIVIIAKNENKFSYDSNEVKVVSRVFTATVTGNVRGIIVTTPAGGTVTGNFTVLNGHNAFSGSAAQIRGGVDSSGGIAFRSGTTNNEGIGTFLFNQLPPGDYTFCFTGGNSDTLTMGVANVTVLPLSRNFRGLAQDSAANVVSFWPGDSSLKNMVTSGNDAVSNGYPAVGYAAGRPEAQAFSLSGSNYLAAADHADLHLSSYSTSFWFKATSTERQFLTSKSNEHMEIHTNAPSDGRAGIGGADSIRFIPVPGMYVDTPPGAYSPGTWTHIVATYDYGTGTAKIYINGSETNSVTTGAKSLDTSDDANPFFIGRRHSGILPFTGLIELVQVYNSALTQTEVTNLYTDKPLQAPVASWPGNGSGVNLAPSAVPVAAYDATNTQTTIAYADDRQQAFNFTGTNHLTVADTAASGSTPLHLPSYSISLWFKASKTGIQFLTAKGYEHMEIHLDANGVPGSIRFIPVTGMYVDTAAGAYRTGEWTHVVATYNYATGTGTMYVNGSNKVTKTMAAIDMSGDPVHFLMGVRNNGSYIFTGQMAQVALFGRALTDQEASDLYRSEAPAGYMVSFNSTDGSAVADQSVPDNGNAVKPANPTRTGYTFDHWCTTAALTTAFDFTTPITTDTTLYAKWQAVIPGGTRNFRGLAQDSAASAISFWPGDGSLKNMILPGADAVSNGSPVVGYAAGRPEAQAFSLSGTNYLAAADHTALHVPSYSISLWFKATNTGVQFLTAKGFEHMEIHTNQNGSIRFIPVPGMYVDTPAGVYSAGTWTHVVATFDFFTGGTMYINGSDTHATTTYTSNWRLGLPADSAPFHIGMRSDGGCKFTGLIELIDVYNSALTQADVTRLYNDYLTLPPVASWHGFGSGGNQAPSAVPVTAYDATNTQTTIAYADDRQQAFNFTGTNHLTVADTVAGGSTPLHLPSYSISLWFKASNTGIQFLTAKGMEHMEIHLDANGVPGSIRFIPVTGMYVDTAAGAYRTGEWTHVVATYNYATGTGTMYVNGSNKVTKTMAAIDMSGDPVHFLMGVRNNGSYIFTGQMAQVALFNRALSDQVASNLYGTEAPAEYTVSFNSTDGSTVADQNVLYSSTAAIPVNPTRTGYTFDHWCTNALLTTAFDFITPITTDTTLYAKWQVNNSAVHILGTASPLDSAVVSFWPGNGSFNNMVTTGNDAVSNGNPAVSYADGKPGAKAFSLSGANYLAAADHPALHAPSYSISLWFKASSTEPQFLTAKGFEHMELHTNQNGGIRFIPVSGMFVDTPAGAYSVGTWTHVVATYNYETGKGIMYVNGSDSHATANFDRRTNLSADPAPFYLGVRSNSMYKFTGQIQQVRLFGSALAAADVTNLYKDTLTLTPIASWSGDSTGDNLAPSAVPVTAYDATNTQTAIAYADGRHQAFNFTGTNYLTVADTVAGGATPLHNKSYSMSLWFKATSTGPQFLTAKMLEHMEIHTNTDGSIRFIPVSGMYVDTPAGAYSAGTWTHIVATYDYATGTGTMYVNGVTQATRTLAAIDMSADTTPYYLAVRNDGGYKFTGQMEQVGLFGRALSDQEALDMYNHSRPVL